MGGRGNGQGRLAALFEGLLYLIFGGAEGHQVPGGQPIHGLADLFQIPLLLLTGNLNVPALGRPLVGRGATLLLLALELAELGLVGGHLSLEGQVLVFAQGPDASVEGGQLGL